MQHGEIIRNRIWKCRGNDVIMYRATYILFCLRTLIARDLTASCAGPGLVFLICSLYRASSASSLFIFSSTVSPLLFICKSLHTNKY